MQGETLFGYSTDLMYFKKGSEEWGTPLIPPTINTGENTADAFRIYPNPARGEIRLVGLPVGARSKILISDLAGKQVLEIPITGEKQKIDIAGLEPGLYLASITTREIQKSVKLIIK